MSNFSNHGYDCIVPRDLQPNSTTLATINACQLNASTPFCWPPNGTRFCVNPEYKFDSKVTLYWPETFYDPNALLNIVYDTGTAYSGLANTSNETKYMTPDLYDMSGIDVPHGDPTETPQSPELGRERQWTIFMFQRQERDKDDLTRGLLFRGPVLTLVKTDIWDTPARSPPPRQRYCIFGQNATCDRDAGSSNGSIRSRGTGSCIWLVALCSMLIGFSSFMG